MKCVRIRVALLQRIPCWNSVVGEFKMRACSSKRAFQKNQKDWQIQGPEYEVPSFSRPQGKNRELNPDTIKVGTTLRIGCD